MENLKFLKPREKNKLSLKRKSYEVKIHANKLPYFTVKKL